MDGSFIEENDLDDVLIQEKTHSNIYCYFTAFKCPACQKIYLYECEHCSIHADPEHPEQFINDWNFSHCVLCESKFPSIFIGKKADMSFRVTREEFLASPWHWAMQDRRY